MTLAEALRLMDTLVAAYPKQELRTETVHIYAGDLLDLPLAVAEKAFMQVRRESAFFPSISEIRSAAAELTLNAPSPMEAWEQAHRLPTGERHPLVDRARRMVGDPYDWRTGTVDHLRPAFIGAYKEIRAQAVRDVQAGGLPSPVAALPPSEQFTTKPVFARLLRRMSGETIGPASEEEKADAILILKAGPVNDGDRLYQEAFSIMDTDGQ